MYIYKCVPVPTGVEMGKKMSQLEAIKIYQDLINQEASQGWEYVSVDSIETYYVPGCLDELLLKIPIVSLFIRKPEGLVFKLIVFKRSA